MASAPAGWVARALRACDCSPVRLRAWRAGSGNRGACQPAHAGWLAEKYPHYRTGIMPAAGVACPQTPLTPLPLASRIARRSALPISRAGHATPGLKPGASAASSHARIAAAGHPSTQQSSGWTSETLCLCGRILAHGNRVTRRPSSTSARSAAAAVCTSPAPNTALTTATPAAPARRAAAMLPSRACRPPMATTGSVVAAHTAARPDTPTMLLLLVVLAKHAPTPR